MFQLFTFDVSPKESSRTRLTNFIFSSGEVVAAAVVVFSVVGFLDFPGSPVCLADCLVVFVDLFAAVAVVDFAAFFFYPFFQDCANLYVQPHPQIQVQLPGVLMK